MRRLLVWCLAVLALTATLVSCRTATVVIVPTLAPSERPFPLLPAPTKVIGMMYNFPSREGEPDHDPGFYVRSANALTTDGAAIAMPQVYDTVYYEAELVVIIGKRARRVSETEASGHILGYTCGMDGTPIVTDADGSRNLARSIGGKSIDGIAPVGPRIASQLNVSGHDIILRINGEEVERANTNDFVLSPALVVSQLSEFFTLEPGDMIFMGASRLVPQMTAGHEVEVEITGIGILRHTVEGRR